jgi:Fic/DOC family
VGSPWVDNPPGAPNVYRRQLGPGRPNLGEARTCFTDASSSNAVILALMASRSSPGDCSLTLASRASRKLASPGPASTIPPPAESWSVFFLSSSRRILLKLSLKIEAREQLSALNELVGIYGPSHRFTSADICKIHRIWLGSVYPWAGRYRLVNLSKAQFPFATAGQIPGLMEHFEKSSLYEYTPCNFKEVGKIIRAIAVVHTELILIHPPGD